MDPFLGEIRMFAGNFPPRGWAFCDGALLPISQNSALFSLLGVNFGGDGTSTFGLPNLQARFPMHAGQGPGLTPRPLGSTGGEPTVTLTQNQVPPHSHALMAASAGSTGTPSSSVALAPAGDGGAIYRTGGARTPMSPTTVGSAGGGQAHNNLQPYLAVSFIIALQGIYPARP